MHAVSFSLTPKQGGFVVETSTPLGPFENTSILSFLPLLLHIHTAQYQEVHNSIADTITFTVMACVWSIDATLDMSKQPYMF